MLHHISMAVENPLNVAQTLAEIWKGRNMLTFTKTICAAVLLISIASPSVVKAENNDAEIASNDTNTLSGKTKGISSLVGKWVWGSSGSTTYGTNGGLLGSNGSRFTYEFLPNGKAKNTGMMNLMSGACNQQIFQSRQGTFRLAGNTMTIKWSPARFTRDFSCDRANNYTKTLPAETQTYQVRFKDDLGQRQLCLTRKDETCYSPTN